MIMTFDKPAKAAIDIQHTEDQHEVIVETEMTYVGDTVFDGGTDYEIRAILNTKTGGEMESELTLVEALNLNDESTAYLILLNGDVDHVEENKTAAEEFYNSYFSDLEEFGVEFGSDSVYDEDEPNIEDDDYYKPTDASYDSTGRDAYDKGISEESANPFPDGSDLARAYDIWVKHGKPQLSTMLEGSSDAYWEFADIARDNGVLEDDIEESASDIAYQLLSDLGLLDEDGLDIQPGELDNFIDDVYDAETKKAVGFDRKGVKASAVMSASHPNYRRFIQGMIGGKVFKNAKALEKSLLDWFADKSLLVSYPDIEPTVVGTNYVQLNMEDGKSFSVNFIAKGKGILVTDVTETDKSGEIKASIINENNPFTENSILALAWKEWVDKGKPNYNKIMNSDIFYGLVDEADQKRNVEKLPYYKHIGSEAQAKILEDRMEEARQDILLDLFDKLNILDRELGLTDGDEAPNAANATIDRSSNSSADVEVEKEIDAILPDVVPNDGKWLKVFENGSHIGNYVFLVTYKGYKVRISTIPIDAENGNSNIRIDTIAVQNNVKAAASASVCKCVEDKNNKQANAAIKKVTPDELRNIVSKREDWVRNNRPDLEEGTNEWDDAVLGWVADRYTDVNDVKEVKTSANNSILYEVASEIKVENKQNVCAAVNNLIKIRITGAGDAELNGDYVTDNSIDEVKRVADGTRSLIKITKLLRNGTLSKRSEYFPFRSYHSNKSIAKAYEERNGNAKLEIIGEVENQDESGLVVRADGIATFTYAGQEYIIKPDEDKIRNQIWLDDEGETYKNLDKMTEQERRDLFISHNNSGTRVLSPESGRYWSEYDLQSRMRWAEEDGDTQSTELFKKVKEYIDKKDIERDSEISKYYDRYKDKIHFSGYWVNR